VQGARDSATSKQHAYRGKYIGGMLVELVRGGHIDVLATRLRDLFDPSRWGKGLLDDKIAIEHFELSMGGKGVGRTDSEEAKKIAAIIYKWQEIARADLNRLGANIGKLPGYIVSQSHDMYRIRAAGFDKWREAAEAAFGGDRTYESIKFTGDEAKDRDLITEFWRHGWNQLSNGQHYKADEPSGFTGTGNLAKRESASRVYHPKSPEAWIEYHNQYGMGSYMESVLGGFHRTGSAAGLMEKFGTNPRQMFQSMITDAQDFDLRQGIPSNTDRLGKGGWTQSLWDAVDGTLDIPASVRAARIGQGVRAVQSLAKLGGAAISSIGDVAISMSAIQDDFGKNMFESLLDHLRARFAQLGDQGKIKELAMIMRVGIDTLTSNVASRISESDGYGSRGLNKVLNGFFRLNAQAAITDNGERAHAAMIAAEMTLHEKKPFNQLPKEMQSIFKRHDISPAEWDLYRKFTGYDIPDSDGLRVMAGDLVREIPLEEMDTLIEWPLEAINIQSEEGLARIQKKAEALVAKLDLFRGEMDSLGKKGFQVGFMKGMRDMAKSLQAAKYAELKAGFKSTFTRAANVLEGFTKRDIEIMGQHANKIDRLKTRLEKAKDIEPATLRQITEVTDEIKKVRESFSAAVDELMSGNAKDETIAGKLKSRAERLQERLGKLKDSLGKAGDYGQAIDDLTTMSDYIKGMQRSDYEAVLEKQRKRVVSDVASGTRTLARQHAKEAAEFAKLIQKNIETLKASKSAEPAVIAKIGEMQTSLKELQKSIDEWPAKLKRQMDAERELARQKLETKLHQFYMDRVLFAGVIRGGAAEKAMTTGGAQSGTVVGEMARMVMQFKNYPISFVKQILGRIAQEDQFARIPGALARRIAADPWGAGSQMAQLMISLTAMGYLSMALKSLVKGQTPADPRLPSTWTAAFVQGGGAGIYGDFLMSRVNRFGGTLLETAAGPGVGAIADAGDVLLKSRQAIWDKLNGNRSDVPDNEIFELFKNNTPFLNLFYVRAPLDYLALYHLQETISPGSLKRLESRLKSERNQEFLLPPSEYAVGEGR
jgi:hypothetical protein